MYQRSQIIPGTDSVRHAVDRGLRGTGFIWRTPEGDEPAIDLRMVIGNNITEWGKAGVFGLRGGVINEREEDGAVIRLMSIPKWMVMRMEVKG